jgi:hypothetical protein
VNAPAANVLSAASATVWRGSAIAIGRSASTGVPPERRKFMLFNMSANVIGLALASTFRF